MNEMGIKSSQNLDDQIEEFGGDKNSKLSGFEGFQQNALE